MLKNKNSILLFLLVILIPYLIISLYFLDKYYFLCPIEFQGEILIRNDGRGDGLFGAERSGNRHHQGLDLFAPQGTPVLASRCGWVVSAKHSRGMGNFVLIKHPQNFLTIYGHLSRIDVRRGQLVRQGEVVGRVGKTGNANYRDIQPHLHLEVRKKGIPQDPLRYLE